ncbi:MAG: hypothetical protein AAF311_02725 [Pseudomonadota bacterium]
MSVIARKIAIANKPVDTRPDPGVLAAKLVKPLRGAFISWLGIQEIEVELTDADWASPDPSAFTGPAMKCTGRRRTQRALVCINECLATRAALDLLRVDAAPTEDELAVLRPFVQQNLLALGERLNDTPMGKAAGAPPWVAPDLDDIQTEFAPYDVLSFEVRIRDGGTDDLRVRLFLTEDILGAVELDDGASEPAPAPHQPPRLGPCRVEVRAVGDRISLSVADCTRLRLGQVVGLPGLRFDRLRLDVEMDDGRVELSDAALGADKGRKAVRLNRGLDPAFRERPPGSAGGEALPIGVPS